MVEFKIIDFYKKDEWKEIVKDKEIYYQWEYVDAFYKNGDGQPFLAYAKKDNKYVYNVFFKRDISEDKKLKGKINKNEYFDIISPYGYAGIDIIGEKDNELLEFFFEEFENYCKKNKIISEFIRLNPLSDNYSFYNNTNYEITNISETVYINLQNEEQIWADMKSTCRNRIRKAINSKLILKSGFDLKMLREFIDIYTETMERDKATEYYFFKQEFFDSIYKNMKNNAKIYTVYMEEKPIDSILVIYNNKNAHYHLGGTLSDCMNLGAHNLSIYEAAKDLCKMGYNKFHLGGGYGGDDSPLLRFKKTFNKENELLNFYIGKKIYDKKEYNKLVELRMKDSNFNINSNFFPIYRN